ncbi:MAG: CBS domain-containing protein [Gammaproteobacteria bacterium]
MAISQFTLSILAAHPQNSAQSLEVFEPPVLASLLSELPATIAAEIVHELPPALAAATLTLMENMLAASVIKHLDADRAALILRRLAHAKRHEVFNLLPAAQWVSLRMVLRYPEDTVGAVMDPDVLSVHTEMPVANILKNMRLFKSQLLHTIYVTDRNHAFSGILDIRELFFARDNQLAGELSQRPEVVITARTPLHSVKSDRFWASATEYPVVDNQRRFLGVLHRNSLLQAMQHLHDKSQDAGLGETALALSEVLWSAWAGIFSGAAPIAAVPPSTVTQSRQENTDES